MAHVEAGSWLVVHPVGQVVVVMPNKHDVVVAWFDVVETMMDVPDLQSRNC
jgi:hypothetical protein